MKGGATMKKPTVESDPEITAIGSVYKALGGLAPEAQARVLKYVSDKLSISASIEVIEGAPPRPTEEPVRVTNAVQEQTKGAEDGLEGISPAGRKWMTRNGIHSTPLSTIFSIGGDEIDLIASDVPGKNKKDKMHSVFLLKGIAAYLGSGASHAA